MLLGISGSLCAATSAALVIEKSGSSPLDEKAGDDRRPADNDPIQQDNQSKDRDDILISS